MLRLSHPRFATLLLIILVGFNILTFTLGWSEYFQYQRYGIGQWEIWRLLTGHWVHVSPMHFLFNLFGLIILWLIIADWLGNRDAILVMGISMLLISLGLYYIYPEVQWYRGLSGALHALWSAAAFLGLERRRTMAIPLLALLLIKLGWEVAIGPLPLSREISGGDVLIQSHWLGAASGLLVAAGYMILKLFKSRSPI